MFVNEKFLCFSASMESIISRLRKFDITKTDFICFRMYLFLLSVVAGINFVGWIIAAVFQTHKNFDVFGSISFCICASTSLFYSTRAFPQRLQTLLVLIWALRLGQYLKAFFHVSSSVLFSWKSKIVATFIHADISSFFRT